MQTGPVVEALDVVEDHQPGCLPCGGAFCAEALGFERRPEALYRGVIIAVAPLAH